jgi:hypothetical protein
MRGLIGGRVWRKTRPLNGGGNGSSGSGTRPSKDLDKLIQITMQAGTGKGK